MTKEREWEKFLHRADQNWILKGRDRELWGAVATQPVRFGQRCKKRKRWQCSGSCELSSVEKKMVGRVLAKLGKIFKVYEWKMEVFRLYSVCSGEPSK